MTPVLGVRRLDGALVFRGMQAQICFHRYKHVRVPRQHVVHLLPPAKAKAVSSHRSPGPRGTHTLLFGG